MQEIDVKLELMESSSRTPAYQHPEDAGADLACIEELNLLPHQVVVARTGLKMAIPAGHALLVCSRSGMARDLGVMVINSPGIVDAGFLGEIRVLLLNTSDKAVHLREGTRVAQAVFVPVVRVNFSLVPSLEKEVQSSRGAGGFGSTGLA